MRERVRETCCCGEHDVTKTHATSLSLSPCIEALVLIFFLFLLCSSLLPFSPPNSLASLTEREREESQCQSRLRRRQQQQRRRKQAREAACAGEKRQQGRPVAIIVPTTSSLTLSVSRNLSSCVSWRQRHQSRRRQVHFYRCHCYCYCRCARGKRERERQRQGRLAGCCSLERISHSLFLLLFS